MLVVRSARRAAVPGLPVFASGGLQTPEKLEAFLVGGNADAILMARALLADPEYAVNVQ